MGDHSQSIELISNDGKSFSVDLCLALAECPILWNKIMNDLTDAKRVELEEVDGDSLLIIAHFIDFRKIVKGRYPKVVRRPWAEACMSYDEETVRRLEQGWIQTIFQNDATMLPHLLMVGESLKMRSFVALLGDAIVEIITENRPRDVRHMFRIHSGYDKDEKKRLEERSNNTFEHFRRNGPCKDEEVDRPLRP